MAGISSALLADDDFMELYKQSLANQQWQSQLASGANLAKNLNAQALLGLLLGTGLGTWAGHKFGNWYQDRKDRLRYGTGEPTTNPDAINVGLKNALDWQGDFNLGWAPQYPFPTAKESVKNYFAPPPQSFNWQLPLIKNSYPQPAPTRTTVQPTQNFLPTTTTQPQMVDKPFGSEWKPTWG